MTTPEPSFAVQLNDGRYLNRKLMIVQGMENAHPFNEEAGRSAARSMFGADWPKHCRLVTYTKPRPVKKKPKKMGSRAKYLQRYRRNRWLLGLCMVCPRQRENLRSRRCNACNEIKKMKAREARQEKAQVAA